MPAQTSILAAANARNLAELAVETSLKRLVLPYDWTDWADPCHRLFPVLQELAEAYRGRILIVSLRRTRTGP